MVYNPPRQGENILALPPNPGSDEGLVVAKTLRTTRMECYTHACYNKALTCPPGLSVFSVERSVWEARTGQANYKRI